MVVREQQTESEENFSSFLGGETLWSERTV